jgi:hypothetical protein
MTTHESPALQKLLDWRREILDELVSLVPVERRREALELTEQLERMDSLIDNIHPLSKERKAQMDGFRQACDAERYLYGEPQRAVFSKRLSNKTPEARAYWQAVRIIQKAQLRIIRDDHPASAYASYPASGA